MATTRYCVTIDLRGGLQMSRAERDGIIMRKSGQRLNPDEILEVFIDYLRQGFDVLPVCGHHDDKGHCLGHPVPDEAETGTPA